jgi:phosphoribosylaminoimidazole-succinocarboxamide synthase
VRFGKDKNFFFIKQEAGQGGNSDKERFWTLSTIENRERDRQADRDRKRNKETERDTK